MNAMLMDCRMIMTTLPITVTLTPTAPTPRALSTARVTRDTLEMESLVWVSELTVKNIIATSFYFQIEIAA